MFDRRSVGDDLRAGVGVSGPAAGLAVMVAAGIESLGLEAYLLAVIVCGVVQIAAGFLKVGHVYVLLI